MDATSINNLCEHRRESSLVEKKTKKRIEIQVVSDFVLRNMYLQCFQIYNVSLFSYIFVQVKIKLQQVEDKNVNYIRCCFPGYNNKRSSFLKF